jgi:cyclic beta-1,2-glucan synthetase
VIRELKPGKRTPFERLLDVATRFGRADSLAKFADEEPPLRSELFSADQMEQHGKSLALAHRLAPGRAPDQLLTRLAENDRILAEVCDLLTTAVTTNRRITPAAEWLLDNFYLVEEQIRTARRHLPKGYSRELPRLAGGPSARLRVSTISRSRRSPTATAGLTPRAFPVSWRPTRR